MFGGTGSNRDVRPESLSHRRHREEKVVPSSPSWPVPHKPKESKRAGPAFGAKAPQDRDGRRQPGGGLPGKEGVGEGSVALPAGCEDLRPHPERLPLPASQLRSAGAFLAVPYRPKPAFRVADPSQIVVLNEKLWLLRRSLQAVSLPEKGKD
jgi:hypothetical protein